MRAVRSAIAVFVVTACSGATTGTANDAPAPAPPTSPVATSAPTTTPTPTSVIATTSSAPATTEPPLTRVTAPGTYEDTDLVIHLHFRSEVPEIGSDGSMAMSLGFSSGPVSAGVYWRKPNGSYEPVALSFEDAPGSGGALFSSFGWLGMNDAGQVAFVATLDDGRSAIYLATPSPAAVPLLPAPLVPVLAALLAGTGIAARRSARSR